MFPVVFFSYHYLFVFSVPRPKILNTVLDNIGQTPLVRINKIGKDEGLKCELCKLGEKNPLSMCIAQENGSKKDIDH